MAGLQPNHKPAVQEALQWLKDNGRDSCASEQPSDPRLTKRFVPAKAVRKHFDYTRLTTIVEALRPEFQLFQCQRVASSILREGYQLVFCVLLRINKAQHIETFLRHDLSDKFLPFDQKPHGFPDGVSFDAFRDKQRPFCAYTLLAGMVKSIASETIIAIESREELAKGDGTTIYKIRLHPEYDGLEDDDELNQNHLSHTYVLKVYDGPDAQKHHDSEVNAYGKIQTGGLHTESLLRYYGTYTYEGMYHVILEYADVGTLEEYFKTVPIPTEGKDIIALWRGVFALADAVFRIHMQHGWHQDIDLKNILIRSHPKLSPYSWPFKLADYGRSHFKDPDIATLAMDYDTFGTKTCGAPECYRPDRFSQTTRLQVPQGVDIWSLGCVWSEVAVWIVKGYSGLETYRRRRKAATDELGIDNPGCFHDGHAVLSCIREVHDAHRWEAMSDEDFLTGNVWQGLIENMLQSKASERPSPRELRQETSRRLLEAEARLPGSVRITTGSADIPQVTTCSHSRARTVPDVSDPEFMSEQKRRHTSASMNTSMLQGRSPLTMSPRQSLDRPNVASSSLPMRDRTFGFGRRPDTVEEDEVASDDCGEGPSTPQRSPPSRVKYHTTSPAPINTSPEQSHVPLTRRGQSENFIEQRRRTVQDSSQLYGDELVVEEFRGDPSYGTDSRKRKDSRFGDRSGFDLPSLSSTGNDNSSRSIPVLEILAAFHWMSQKRRGDRYAYLPYGDQLKGLLRDRDHLFLIDDSTSMYSCRSELCALFELLAYIVEDDDPDGVEVLCANSGASLKEKDSSKLAKHVNNIQWNGRTRIEKRLEQILGSYEEKLRGNEKKRLEYEEKRRKYEENVRAHKLKLRARAPDPIDPTTPLTVYILTDGVWEGGGEPEVPIMAMVQTLVELGLPREQVGVQFIVLGENKAGQEHMENVDNMQIAYGLELDIVDTEPANGNVWKMLRGAIDAVFDAGGSAVVQEGQ
ncbi:hypothetical protein LTR17_015025 [Elasticomyces elasticus]|nr:hypothetical protein LTR17_015025 [Elasticomyces elasticus]